jgi:hypothetical protein
LFLDWLLPLICLAWQVVRPWHPFGVRLTARSPREFFPKPEQLLGPAGGPSP